MKYLLDTHIIVWMFFYPEKLPNKAVPILRNQGNVFFYSVASMWEIAIKHRKHPKQIQHTGVEFREYCEAMGFFKLEVDDRHICALETLAQVAGTPPHEDPFDRLLLAQAKGDGMKFLTHDKKFLTYNEPCVLVV